MSDPATAIFSVLTPKLEMGTAVAIREDLLVTCHHVVRDAKEVDLFSHHPVFEGKKSAKGKVIATAKSLDLALLRSNIRLPFLELKEREDIDDSMPLRIWSWPGWNAWWASAAREKEIQAITPSTLSPTPHAAVMTDSWTEEENNTLRFSFAGRIEGEMSGGPLVSALNNKIVGIITAGWDVDPDEVAETWREFYGCQQDHDPGKSKAIRAQLGLGMGIAISLKELKVFLGTKAP